MAKKPPKRPENGFRRWNNSLPGKAQGAVVGVFVGTALGLGLFNDKAAEASVGHDFSAAEQALPKTKLQQACESLGQGFLADIYNAAVAKGELRGVARDYARDVYGMGKGADKLATLMIRYDLMDAYNLTPDDAKAEVAKIRNMDDKTQHKTLTDLAVKRLQSFADMYADFLQVERDTGVSAEMLSTIAFIESFMHHNHPSPTSSADGAFQAINGWYSDALKNHFRKLPQALQKTMKAYEADGGNMADYKRHPLALAYLFAHDMKARGITSASDGYTAYFAGAQGFEDLRNADQDKSVTAIKKPWVDRAIKANPSVFLKQAPLLDRKTKKQMVGSDGKPMFTMVPRTPREVFAEMDTRVKNGEKLLQQHAKYVVSMDAAITRTAVACGNGNIRVALMFLEKPKQTVSHDAPTR